MVEVRASNSNTRPGGRLNLLLSYGGWQKDSWAHRLPTLLEPMGVRARMARSGREASDLVRREPIHLAVVDLALPLDADDDQREAAEEGGAQLLQLLARLDSPPPTIVVKPSRQARDDARIINVALNLGAFAVVDRPVEMELMLEVFRRALRRHYANRWPSC